MHSDRGLTKSDSSRGFFDTVENRDPFSWAGCSLNRRPRNVANCSAFYVEYGLTDQLFGGRPGGDGEAEHQAGRRWYIRPNLASMK